MIDGKTRTLGLIGKPVEHTLSPVIHNNLAEMLKQNVVYVPLLVEEDLHAAISGAYALNLLGMNVTVPYKNDVIEELVEIDSLAKRIGAVNTLVRVPGGYKGYNTDALGLKRELLSEDITVEGKYTVVLGAGGASCAVVHLLADMGAKDILLLNRTVEKAEQLCAQVNAACGRIIAHAGKLQDYQAEMKYEEYLAIQCTSVGLHPKDTECVITEESFYQKIATGVDLIYNPEETMFMKQIRSKGKKACNGLKMLLYQGVIAFELFTGTTVTEEAAQDIYRRLKEELQKNG